MSDLGTVRYSELFSTATVAGTSSPYPLPRGPTSYQATVVTTSTGANAVVTAVVRVDVSNDAAALGWLALGTMTSTTSGGGSDGFAAIAPWKYARLVCTTLTTGVAARLVSGVAA